MGLFGPPNVEKMKAKRDVKGLIKALSYKKYQATAGLRESEGREVRQEAAWALAQLGDARAVGPLIATLKDNDSERNVLAEVAGGLVKIGVPAVEPLIAALKDGDANMHAWAARVLGKIGDARAVEPLIAALKDSEAHVRESAAKALEKMGWRPDQDETGAAYWVANQQWDKCAAIGAPAVVLLITALKDGDFCVRGAASALGQIGDARAVKPLIAALKCRDASTRSSAASALGQISDARAVKPLIAALKDSEAYVRESAAKALEKMGWRPGQDESGAVHWVVNHQWDKCVEIGAPAVAPLIAALKSSSHKVRGAAEGALVKIGTPAVELLIAALKDCDSSIRLSAERALGQIGDARAVEPLIAALKDSGEFVRKEAACALGRIGDARAVEPLVAVLKGSDYKDVRLEAACALGKIGDARAVEPLSAALKDSDKWLGKAAADALGKIGDARGVEPLIAALKDSADFVRRAAQGALEKMGWRPGEDESQDAQRVALECSPMMRDRWNSSREHSGTGVIMVAGHYNGCKLVASFDAETGDACAVEVQFKNAAVSKHLANEALAAWSSALSADSLVISDLLVQTGWRTGKPPGATYIVMAIRFPQHDTDTCCKLSTEWKDINPCVGEPLSDAGTPGTGDEAVLAAASKGNRIHAMKLYRDTHGASLEEAKRFVDGLPNEPRPPQVGGDEKQGS